MGSGTCSPIGMTVAAVLGSLRYSLYGRLPTWSTSAHGSPADPRMAGERRASRGLVGKLLAGSPGRLNGWPRESSRT